MAARLRQLGWHQRGIIHLILAGGGVFFLLPLLWMIATSFKPLDQTMKLPESLGEALVGRGWRAVIDGQSYEVVRERKIAPAADSPVYIVRPLKQFLAGELTKHFGPDQWNSQPYFSQEELAMYNTPVTPGMRVLAEGGPPLTLPAGRGMNRFDPDAGQLTLMSGNVVSAELVRRVEADPAGRPLWLVRQWLPADTDAKEVGSTAVNVTRAWDILPEDQIAPVARVIAQNYPAALRRAKFGRSLGNTVFLCAMCVAGAVVSSVIVAYGFAFLEFRGRGVLFALTMATMMIPFPVVMIPLFLLYGDLGWVGSFKPLWVSSWFGSAFFIFLLRQFFLGLPRDLLDAARIDGCGELEILWRVVVPLSRPAIAMVALFTFLGTWKDFLGPLLYLSHPSQFTLSLSLQAFASEQGGTPWHLLMAASTVFSLPLIVLFFLAMKTFIRGIATAGLKG